MIPAKTCENCAAFSALTNECRRKSPTPIMIQHPNAQPATIGVFPATSKERWCMEWTSEISLATRLETSYCVGITNGSDVDMFAPFLDSQHLIADFRMMPFVCPDGHDSLELIVDGYEPPADKDTPDSKSVSIMLMRSATANLLWHGTVNHTALFGKPKLQWIEVSYKSYGI
jgi:hypothetical protein